MISARQGRILKCLAGLAVVYLVVLLGYYIFQRSILYHPHFPDSNPPPTPAQMKLDMQVVHIPTADGLHLLAWFAPPKDKTGPVVVVYHGNAATLAHRWQIADEMLKHGFGVFMLEYRGFGGNPGTPTEEGLYTDARASLKWLEGKGYRKSQFIPYGESLGTGVAVQMALEIQPPLLILQAPFSNIADFGAIYFPIFPVDLLLKDRYDSLAKVGRVKSSLLIVHGAVDSIIPIALARKLFAAANEPKKFITIDAGGHNDLYDHGAGPQIAAWLEEQVKKQ